VNIDPELKTYIIEQRIRDGRTITSLSEEYGIAHSTISKWVKEYRHLAMVDAERATALAAMEENNRLRARVAELEKENDFLKKAAAFFAKESK
ncbi:MAG: transposase, partial [Clostridia bacterium]|nr:transposase [Clostridia bacterium]